MCKPLTVTWNLDDDKLLWRALLVLDEITHLEVHNLEEKLNLRKVIPRNFRFDLSTQRTLDFQQSTRLRDAVRTSAEKFVYRMLHETNLV
jgi:hypothetical protein